MYLITQIPILQDRAVVVIVGLLEELPEVIPRGFAVVELEESGCAPMLGRVPASWGFDDLLQFSWCSHGLFLGGSVSCLLSLHEVCELVCGVEHSFGVHLLDSYL